MLRGEGLKCICILQFVCSFYQFTIHDFFLLGCHCQTGLYYAGHFIFKCYSILLRGEGRSFVKIYYVRLFCSSCVSTNHANASIYLYLRVSANNGSLSIETDEYREIVDQFFVLKKVE